MEKLSDRIRNIRELNGYTQLDVASRMNISSSAYGKMERNANYSSYETLLKIANAIGVSITFLLEVDSNCFKE